MLREAADDLLAFTGFRPQRWKKILVETHDEWQTGDRRYVAEGTMPC